jgi:hypothetical protein
MRHPGRLEQDQGGAAHAVLLPAVLSDLVGSRRPDPGQKTPTRGAPQEAGNLVGQRSATADRHLRLEGHRRYDGQARRDTARRRVTVDRTEDERATTAR